MLQLTEAAQVSLKRLISRREEKAGSTSEPVGLRIAVERGGCAGMQYSLKIATKQEQDLLVERDQCRVFIDRESAPFLDQCVLDYKDALHDSGFTLHNPQAVRSCGCGTSFEPAPGSPDAASLPPTSDPCSSEEASSNSSS